MITIITILLGSLIAGCWGVNYSINSPMPEKTPEQRYADGVIRTIERGQYDDAIDLIRSSPFPSYALKTDTLRELLSAKKRAALRTIDQLPALLCLEDLVR